MFDLFTVMRVLAEERPVFHALAWALHSQRQQGTVRLEFKPFPHERFYLDMWMREGNEACAVELKYPTRGIDLTVGDERFVLKDQAAQDITRYDFVKDLVRVGAGGRGWPRDISTGHLAYQRFGVLERVAPPFLG